MPVTFEKAPTSFASSFPSPLTSVPTMVYGKTVWVSGSVWTVPSPTGFNASAVHTSVPKKKPRIRFLVFISSCTPTLMMNGVVCADAFWEAGWTRKMDANIDNTITKTSHTCRDKFVRLRSAARWSTDQPPSLSSNGTNRIKRDWYGVLYLGPGGERAAVQTSVARFTWRRPRETV